MLLRVEKPPTRNNGADETFSSRRTFARNFTNLLRLVSRHGLYIKWKKGGWAIPRRRKEESRYPRHFSRYRSYGISIEFSIKVRYSINVQRLKNDISLHCKLEYGPAWVLNGAFLNARFLLIDATREEKVAASVRLHSVFTARLDRRLKKFWSTINSSPISSSFLSPISISLPRWYNNRINDRINRKIDVSLNFEKFREEDGSCGVIK